MQILEVAITGAVVINNPVKPPPQLVGVVLTETTMAGPGSGVVPSQSRPSTTAVLNCNARIDLPTAPSPESDVTQFWGTRSFTTHCRSGTG